MSCDSVYALQQRGLAANTLDDHWKLLKWQLLGCHTSQDMLNARMGRVPTGTPTTTDNGAMC